MSVPASSATEIVVSAETFQDNLAFHDHVLNAIRESTKYRELVYTDVSVDRGEKIVEVLKETAEEAHIKQTYNAVTKVFWIRVMAEEIHGCHFKWLYDEIDNWLASGLINAQEKRLLWPGSDIIFKLPYGPYSRSSKVPDFFLRVDDERYPRFVVESGWSESWNRLFDDVNTLIVGSGEAIKAVLLLKWQRVGTSNRVRAFAELYGVRGTAPDLKQRVTIFPAPAPGQPPQQLRLQRRLIFGQHLVSGQDPNTILPLDINMLRGIARRALSFMGLVPEP